MSLPLHKLRQALLAFHIKWQPDFDNFVVGPHDHIVKALKVMAGAVAKTSLGAPEEASRQSQVGLYLAGAAGTGKTHLLLATGQPLERRGAGFYLDCSLLDDAAADVLVLNADVRWLLLDNLNHIAGKMQLETALMRCLDQSRLAGRSLVISGYDQPGQLGLKLPDLVSRLNQLPRYGLSPLADEDYARMLNLRAAAAGLKLPPALLPYLLRYLPNNAGALMQAYEQIERAALERARAITVPLASEVLGRSQ